MTPRTTGAIAVGTAVAAAATCAMLASSGRPIIAMIVGAVLMLAAMAVFSRSRPTLPAIDPLGCHALFQLADSTSVQVLCCDAAGRVRWVNRGFAESTGFGLDACLGKKPGEFLQGPRTDPRTVAAFGAAVRAGLPFLCELTNYTRDGVAFEVLVQCEPLRDGAGRLIGFLGVQRDVTAFRAREREARAAQARLEAMDLATPMMSARWSPDGVLVDCNDEFTRQTGLVVGQSIPPAGGMGLDRTLASAASDALARARVHRVERRASDVARHDRDILWSTAAARDAAGWPFEYESLGLDISELRETQSSMRSLEAERALWQSSFEQILEAGGVGWWRRNLLEDTIEVNETYASMLGFTAADFVSRRVVWRELLDPAEAPGLELRMNAIAVNPALASFDLTYRMRRADGAWAWIRDSGRVLRTDAAGQAIMVVGVHLDVTRAHESILRERETLARLTFALEAGDIGTFEIGTRSEDGRLVGFGSRWDPATYRLFGVRHDDPRLPADIMRARMTDEEFARARQFTRDVVALDAADEREFQVVGEGGSARTLRIRARSLRDPRSLEAHVFGVVIDVTALRRAEMVLREQQAELRRMVAVQTADAIASRDRSLDAHRRQAEFFANASHELRTPLHSALGFLRMARTAMIEKRDEPRIADWLQRSQAASERLLTLVDELLEVSRLEANGMRILQAPCDVRELAQAVLLELSPAIRARQLVPTLLGDRGPHRLLADEARVMQVLRNLLSNAIRFSPEGGNIRVGVERVMAANGRAAIQLSVRDDGPGIDPAESEAVFERFYQSRRNASRMGGTGLGLYISRELVRAHGGELWAVAHTGLGAEFRMLLPMEPLVVNGAGLAEAEVRPA